MGLIGGCGPVAAPGNEGATTSMTTGDVSPTTSGAGDTMGITGDTGMVSGTTVVVEPTMPTSEGSEGTSEIAGTTGREFIVPPDGGGLGECDLFAQDCRAGEKCAAYANNGDTWFNDTKCVPVMDDPAQFDEPCFVVGSAVSGVDNCDFGLMCWYTDAENQGRCIALCKGTPEAPYCESPMAVCAVYDGNPLIICTDWCDPLVQDCGVDYVCIGVPDGEGFFCAQDASGDEGQAHDACGYVNACDPGLICLDPATAAECDQTGDGCCEPFCDLDALDVCPGAGQVCNPWFEPGMAPPGYEDVGICGVPM